MKELLIAIQLVFLGLLVNGQSKPLDIKVYGKGQPIILIPGYSCSGEVWKETVEHLQGKYECHVVTLPGFAGVAPIDTPILKTVKNSLVQYIHDKQLKKPILIGHSLGAMMSLWIGSEMPGDISAIICVDGVPAIAAMTNPAINYDSLKKSPVYDAATVATNFVNLPVEGYEKNMTIAMLAQVNDTVRAKQIAHWSAMSDRKTLGYTIVEISLTDLRPALKNIQCPVLVMASIYGDKETSLRVMNEQYANVANKKILVADAKHFIMYDQPQWMYAAIDQFLKK